MFKPLRQQLHEQYGGSPLTPTLHPATVARNFGVVVDVNEPLHESATALRHAEDEQESALLLDTRKTPTEKAAPQSLFAIATARLRAIPARTKERSQEVAQLIALLQEPLMAADEMVSILEQERADAIELRMEDLRTRGRNQKRHVNQVLRAAVNTSLMNWNEAEKIKVHASTKLQSRIDERRALRLDRYSTNEQLAAANEKVYSAVQKLNAAKESHLKAERAKADAENALTTGHAQLRAIEIAMDQCLAELKGTAYHDPNTGLSTQPVAMQQ